MDQKQAFIDQILSEINKEDSLPPLSSNSLLLQEEITRKSSDLGRIETLIKEDPVITAHILRVANSAFYKGFDQITTIREAILRIGIEELGNIAVWAIHHSSFKGKDPVIMEYKKRLLNHSLACAAGSFWLARHLDLDENIISRSFIAGLLHDIGALCIFNALEKLKDSDTAGSSLSNHFQKELIDAFHAGQGYSLLRKWNLPEEYCSVAGSHSQKTFDETNTLLIVIRLVDMICLKMETGNREEDMMAVLSSKEAGLLGVTEITAVQIEIEIESFLEKAGSLS